MGNPRDGKPLVWETILGMENRHWDGKSSCRWKMIFKVSLLGYKNSNHSKPGGEGLFRVVAVGIPC